MKRVGILSDRHYNENCLEYEPMKIGLAQKLYPYIVSPLDGVPLPSQLPVAQRGYNLANLANKLSSQLNLPYEAALGRLIQHSKDIDFPKPKQVVPNVERGGGKRDQASLLAVRVKPRESDYLQLNRTKEPPPPVEGTADTGPTGETYMPKTGKLPQEATSDTGPTRDTTKDKTEL
jgi:hypothetical protein